MRACSHAARANVRLCVRALHIAPRMASKCPPQATCTQQTPTAKRFDRAVCLATIHRTAARKVRKGNRKAFGLAADSAATAIGGDGGRMQSTAEYCGRQRHLLGSCANTLCLSPMLSFGGFGVMPQATSSTSSSHKYSTPLNSRRAPKHENAGGTLDSSTALHTCGAPPGPQCHEMGLRVSNRAKRARTEGSSECSATSRANPLRARCVRASL